MFSDYITNIEKVDCSTKVNMRLLNVGNVYRITFPYITELVGTYSGVTIIPSNTESIFEINIVSNTDVVFDFTDINSNYLIQVTDNVSLTYFTYILGLNCSISSFTTNNEITQSIIPSFNSSSDLYFQLKMALRIHSKMMHRLSNDVMFVGYNDRIRDLYSKLNKLWVLSETLNELLYDNPLFDCDEILSTTMIFESDINIYNKYIAIFNNLYNCIKTTIEYISKNYKKGLTIQSLKTECDTPYDTGDTSSSSEDCIIGDYNGDYNGDYFTEICDNLITYAIRCNTVYSAHVTSSKEVVVKSLIGLSEGDCVGLGYDKDFGLEQSKRLEIVSIDTPTLTLTLNEVIPSTGYIALMKIRKATYSTIAYAIIETSTIISKRYTILGDASDFSKDTSIVITDNNGIKYYDVIDSYSFDGTRTTLTTLIAGINKINIKTFEALNVKVNAEQC